MNELPVIGSLCYAQRVLKSPRGKQRELLIKVLCEQTRELTHDFLDYV